MRLDPSLGILGLKAFAVALVGGLDSLAGVIPGALLVAAVEVLSVRHGDPLLADVSPFLCLLAMLLVRPWGPSGRKKSWSGCERAWEAQGVLESSFDLAEQVGRQMPQSLHQTSFVDRPNLLGDGLD